MVSKHPETGTEWKYRKREKAGKTNDVFFSEIPLTHSCSNGENGCFMSRSSWQKKKKKKKDSHNFLEFWQSPPKCKDWDNLFTQSFPRTFSNNEGAHLGGRGRHEEEGVREKGVFYFLPLLPTKLLRFSEFSENQTIKKCCMQIKHFPDWVHPNGSAPLNISEGRDSRTSRFLSNLDDWCQPGKG